MNHTIEGALPLALQNCHTDRAALYPMECQTILKTKYLENVLFAFWNQEKMLGLMDRFGRQVIAPIWDSIHIQTDPGVIFCQKNNRTILYGLDGKTLLDVDVDTQLKQARGTIVMGKENTLLSIEMGGYSEGLARGHYRGDVCYVNAKGRLALIVKNGNQSGDFHNGLAVFHTRKKLFSKPTYGYFDQKGKVVIPPVYLSAEHFTSSVTWVSSPDGIHLVRKDGSLQDMWCMKDGKKTAATGFQKAGDFHSGSCKVYRSPEVNSAVLDGLPLNIPLTEGGFALINENGEITTPRLYNILIETKVDNVFQFNNQEKSGDYYLYGLMDARGNVILPPEYTSILEKHCDLFQVERDGKYGLVTKTGKFLLDMEWDMIRVINEETICFRRGELWGVMDLTGKNRIPLSLPGSVIITNGVVLTEENGKLCLQNFHGEPAVRETLEILDCITPGLLVVKYNEKNYVLDLGCQI